MAAGRPELTPREDEVLAAVERRLTNAEIAATFQVSVRTVESHIAALRRKLGAASRAELITAARGRRTPRVPRPQNSFVGREEDVAAVRALQEGSRWVTVVGPAGSGKTRLALELAAADERVPVIVELEQASAADVPTAVAGALGLGLDSAADPVAAAAVAMEAQRYLLVMDNCDRVTEAVASLLGRLLVLCASVSVLATSRSPVGGSDEAIYPLAPLPVDDGGAAVAVRLFLDRARAGAPAELDADADLVARICRRLEGLPLAIELAAARVRHLPLAELADRLDEGFGPLDRAGPAGRHRTLDAAFDWTWDLLDDEERDVLSRLAALPKTFDLDLAETVAGSGAGSVALRLLDRSLVAAAATTGEPRRFRLIEATRAFVLGRTDPEVGTDVRRRHAAYHAVLADGLADRARTDDSRAAAEAARRLLPELTAALDWCVEHGSAEAVPLVRAVAILAEQYGADIGSLDAVARAARDPGVRAAATGSQLLDVGMALCYGDLDQLADLVEFLLARADDAASVLAAHHLGGYCTAYRHDQRSALGHFEVAERLAVELDDAWELASVRQGRGIALRGPSAQDREAAMAAFQSALDDYVRAGDAMHVNNARYMMAATAADGSSSPQALVWADDCIAYSRESGNRHELAHAVLTRARLAPGSDADADLHEAADRFRAVGDLRCLTRTYLHLAAGRSPAEGVPLLDQALAVARSAHDERNQALALEELVGAHWRAGDGREAATALGALIKVIGEEAALDRCPDDLVADLDRWRTAVAEGQARAPQPS